MDDYILTDRDSSLAIYSGINIDWKHFESYLRGLACRCAQKAEEKEYSTFGLQYYGKVFYLVLIHLLRNMFIPT